MSSRLRLIALGSIAATIALVAVGARFAIAKDPRLDLCPTTGNQIVATFEIPSAREYQSWIPRMLRSPELEVDAPAYVVLFGDKATLPVLGAPPGVDAAGELIREQPLPTEFDGVVCVVVDGRPTVYTDVDTTGWKAP